MKCDIPTCKRKAKVRFDLLEVCQKHFAYLMERKLQIQNEKEVKK